ncbi:DUF488 domain-containing protein [Nocardia mexicana]|uniref:Uncharacterized protein YeaO (DUF488 family) n=1 Tax=Nocardia mexicana TaxID=279262 RepID=A0A370H8B9_9NOCA|nr:DUF488 family protein [Nocardia mexicana]RDI52918.1 uncharacterized protein YeaO (DUF488 family) [Nocardia mexicana]
MAQQPRPGFRVKRVYDPAEASDGTRVLVDRLWPRGVSKQRAHIDEWAKDVTPSDDLRRWFHADPEHREAEFRKKYRAELAAEAPQQGLAQLRELAAKGPVTLVTAVRDPRHSQVAVLLEQLER